MLHAAHGFNTVLRHGELVNAAWQRSVDRERQNYRKACRCPTTLLGGDERFLATPGGVLFATRFSEDRA